MGKTMLSGLHPRVKLSIYWLEKERFLLYEDTYDIWVMFAIESGSFYYEIVRSATKKAPRHSAIWCFVRRASPFAG
ncbi:MAG: hypothetical protein K0Q94_5448 [Paenibacillus sp.]|nr:hypothetical protein [Paenibacillus sp.]